MIQSDSFLCCYLLLSTVKYRYLSEHSTVLKTVCPHGHGSSNLPPSTKLALFEPLLFYRWLCCNGSIVGENKSTKVGLCLGAFLFSILILLIEGLSTLNEYPLFTTKFLLLFIKYYIIPTGNESASPDIRRQARSVTALPALHTYTSYVHNCIMQHRLTII